MNLPTLENKFFEYFDFLKINNNSKNIERTTLTVKEQRNLIICNIINFFRLKNFNVTESSYEQKEEINIYDLLFKFNCDIFFIGEKHINTLNQCVTLNLKSLTQKTNIGCIFYEKPNSSENIYMTSNKTFLNFLQKYIIFTKIEKKLEQEYYKYFKDLTVNNINYFNYYLKKKYDLNFDFKKIDSNLSKFEYLSYIENKNLTNLSNLYINLDEILNTNLKKIINVDFRNEFVCFLYYNYNISFKEKRKFFSFLGTGILNELVKNELKDYSDFYKLYNHFDLNYDEKNFVFFKKMIINHVLLINWFKKNYKNLLIKYFVDKFFKLEEGFTDSLNINLTEYKEFYNEYTSIILPSLIDFFTYNTYIFQSEIYIKKENNSKHQKLNENGSYLNYENVDDETNFDLNNDNENEKIFIMFKKNIKHDLYTFTNLRDNNITFLKEILKICSFFFVDQIIIEIYIISYFILNFKMKINLEFLNKKNIVYCGGAHIDRLYNFFKKKKINYLTIDSKNIINASEFLKNLINFEI